jgi:hypothetical protein
MEDGFGMLGQGPESARQRRGIDPNLTNGIWGTQGSGLWVHDGNGG